MHSQLIVVLVSGTLAFLGILILIFSFDENDADWMACSMCDGYQVLTLDWVK